MDASLPLLANDRDGDADVDRGDVDQRPAHCLSRYLSPRSAEGHGLPNEGGSSYSNGREHGYRHGKQSGEGYSNGHVKTNGGGGRGQQLIQNVNGTSNATARSTSPYFAQGMDTKYSMMDAIDATDDGGVLCCRGRSSCTLWPCWKWVFPDRIVDYEDFATSAQMGEIYSLRQTAREFFDPALPEDDDMLQHLWSGLFPMLPYEGRVNVRWRDIGFQNDDPASDLRTSGRLAVRMLLYCSDHLNDEFKRIVRENHFPVCLCALNLLEMLLSHLKLKEPLPLVCPCCGTENAELETSRQPIRTHPELRGLVALMSDASSLASGAFAHQLACAEGGPAEVALAHLFAHSLLVLDAVWKQQLQRDPTTTLMHFREALVETRLRVIAFLSRRRTPLTLVELHRWSSQQRARSPSTKAL